jgi:hypothetical protein
MRIPFLLLILLTAVSSHAQFWKKLSSTPLTNEEVTKGLREALTQGATKGAGLVSKIDGYFKNPEIKIPFPKDARLVETKLRAIGMGSKVDEFVLSLNRAAEDAAKEAAPIFVAAIQNMTINDAFTILKGEPDAATQYLKKTTTPRLIEKFTPIVKNSLNKVDATKYWADLINYYNKIPFVSKVNPDITAYATDMAIQGLFVMVAREEKLIRKDPAARTTDILKKVFK